MKCTRNKFHDGITKHLSTVFLVQNEFIQLKHSYKQLPLAISQQFTVVLWSDNTHLANYYKCSLS